MNNSHNATTSFANLIMFSAHQTIRRSRPEKIRSVQMIQPISLRRLITLLAVFLTLGFAQATDTVATVNGTPISTLAFQPRVRFTRWTLGQQLLQIVQQNGEKALTDPTSPYNAHYKLLTQSHPLGQHE